MSLEVAITEIKRLLEEKPMFKPADDATLANRRATDDYVPSIGSIAILDSADQITMMEDFETVGLSDEDLIRLFSHLIHTGLVDKLQGVYGRQARSLLNGGWISNNGTILKLPSIRRRGVGEAVNEAGIFKPAGDAEISNRPLPEEYFITYHLNRRDGRSSLEIEYMGSGKDLLKRARFLARKSNISDLKVTDSFGHEIPLLRDLGIELGESEVIKEAGMFKPAGEAERANRPQPVVPYRKITSVDQLRELAKFGVEVFMSSGAPLWEMHSFMFISHSTDNTDEWLIDDYKSGRMFHKPQSAMLNAAMVAGKLWYDRTEFENNNLSIENGPLPESVNEATPRKRTPKPKSMFKPASPENLASREEQERLAIETARAARAAQWAGMPDTDLPWEEVARRELSMELDVDIAIDDNQYSEGVSMHAAHGKGNNGESEWVVYETSDDAERAAISRVESDLDSDPTTFNQSFLEAHMTISETDRRMIAQEESDNLVDDVYDDQQILEEAGVESDYQDLQDTIDNLDSDAPDYEAQAAALEAQKEAMLEAAKETTREKKYDEIYDQLEDPIRYFVHETGMYSMEDLMKSSFMQIDTEAAARDAIQSDSVAFYLDTYDGNEVDLPSGAVAFGTN